MRKAVMVDSQVGD